jgi:hypothetical protein
VEIGDTTHVGSMLEKDGNAPATYTTSPYRRVPTSFVLPRIMPKVREYEMSPYAGCA